MGISMKLVKIPDIPLEADCLNPSLAKLKPADIARLKLWQGRTQVEVGEFFSVSAADTTSEDEVCIEGDLERVKRIGQNTSSGKLVVHGNCGMHTGEGLSGGEIEVHGNVGNWSFCLMQGGTARIFGDAGAFLAAAFPGEARGMKGGILWVRGNTGARAVERMRRGLLVVGGALGEFAAVEMIAGTVVSLGRLGSRAGASMKRGSIVVMGEHEPFLNGFERSCAYSPTFVPLLGRELAALGFLGGYSRFSGADKKFTRWCGDMTNLGKGEILVHE